MNDKFTDFKTLDLETRSRVFEMREHAALEPWRVRQGKAEIMSMDIYGLNYSSQLINTDTDFVDKLRAQLKELKGQKVYAHNAIFDIAWLIATLQPDRMGDIPQEILDIKWFDSMLLIKWLVNGQVAERSRFSLSLGNLIKNFLPEHPKCDEFVEFKNRPYRPGENEEYWLERGSLDVEMTWELVAKYHNKVPASMRNGLMAEFECLVPIANSWLMGFRIDRKQLDDNEVYYRTFKDRIASEINVDVGLFSSPKKLSKFLFEDLGLTPHEYTDKGAPSTSKGALMWMEFNLNEAGDHENAKIISKILEAKESTTNYSKYVKTTYEALAHTGDGYIYSSPRLFGTYTGRMTYSGTVQHMDPDTEIKKKFKTSIAMHQIPRKATRVRKMLVPPEGYDILEFDASGQESRLMAYMSRDETMIEIFANKLNFHSMTGASIIGMDYDDFEAARALEKDSGYHTEARQRGKLTNLACNFRISGKALAKQAFEKYDVMISVGTGMHLVKTFATSYSGVPRYWADSIAEGKLNGYVETLGGRRFKLKFWREERWGTESSAIMVPIQGSGAAMKEVAIAELHKKHPEFKFCLDLHDASFGYVKSEIAAETFKRVEQTLNTINYAPYWGSHPDVELPYEGKMGKSFADVK